MREILFRGKRVDNGEWVEGWLYKRCVRTINHGVCVVSVADAIQIYDGEAIESIEYHTVISETVGQYTGLKDKNGKRIFEGDFIHARHVDDSSLTGGVVNFILGCFCVRYNAYNNPAIDTLKEYEVIGNIHDNPELIAEVQDG